MKILSIINLVIAVQALFLCIHFLLKKKGVVFLNRLLSYLSFAFGVVTLNTYLNLLDPPVRSILYQDIANNVMWFVGPCLYFYTIYQERKPNKKLVLYNTVPYLIPASIEIFFDWSVFSVYIKFVGFIQICIYLFLSLRFLFKHYSKYSKYYNWILPAVISFTVVMLFNFVLNILMANGYMLIPNPMRQSFTSLLAVPIFILAYREMNSTNDFGIQPKKYKGTHLSDSDLKSYLKKIENAMKIDELYLEKSLTLQLFSQKIGIQAKYISQVINQQKQMSFSDYVLQFRLEKVKQELIDPKNKNLTIFGIAQDCGFNSNSRFSHLFKKHTGVTASQFQQNHSK